MTSRTRVVMTEWLELCPGRGGADLEDLASRLYFAGFVEARDMAADILVACSKRSDGLAAIRALEPTP